MTSKRKGRRNRICRFMIFRTTLILSSYLSFNKGKKTAAPLSIGQAALLTIFFWITSCYDDAGIWRHFVAFSFLTSHIRIDRGLQNLGFVNRDWRDKRLYSRKFAKAALEVNSIKRYLLFEMLRQIWKVWRKLITLTSVLLKIEFEAPWLNPDFHNAVDNIPNDYSDLNCYIVTTVHC